MLNCTQYCCATPTSEASFSLDIIVYVLVMREQDRLQGGNIVLSRICCHALLFVLLNKGYFSIHSSIVK